MKLYLLQTAHVTLTTKYLNVIYIFIVTFSRISYICILLILYIIINDMPSMAQICLAPSQKSYNANLISGRF